MSEVRSTSNAGTKYCGQCSFYGGERKVQGSYLLYDSNSKGRCNRRAGQGPYGGKEVKVNHTCSAFDKWNF